MSGLPRSLIRLGGRTLRRRPWQTALMLLGITLGVAVVVAVDLANASAGRAFDLSTEAVAGRATHEIVGGPEGLDETRYVALRRQGVLHLAAPVVADYVSSPRLGERPFQLLGVDPFAEPPFRDYLWVGASSPPGEGLAFLTRPGAVLISADVADEYGLAVGDPLPLNVAGVRREGFVAGLLRPGDALQRRALEGLILADVATAQELLDRVGRLDRIDLILPPDVAADRIAARLPADVRIQTAEARTSAIRQLTASFRTNLTALSLLALFVGVFLIYNTMTFSVVQRRPLFGTLRCLGVTPREIFTLVVGEALVVGVVGAALGVLLGVAMGRNAVGAVTQTITDLYFVLTVRDVGVPASSLLKGWLVGVAATVLAAGAPAWEAATVPPRAALSRSGLESKARRAVRGAALASLVALGLGGGLLALPTHSLIVSFASLAAFVVGFALLTPLATAGLMRGAAVVLGRPWGTLGRMAPRDVIASLSRTAVAVAALMVAVAVTIGVGLMIGSFRRTVVTWLGYALQGDLYVQAPSFKATQNTRPLDPAVPGIVADHPAVGRAELIRAVYVDSPAGPVYLEVGTSADYGEGLLYRSADGPPAQVWAAVRRSGAVIVSEPFANRLGLPARDGTVTLNTDRGPRTFDVAGIYYDYASSAGAVIMAIEDYRRYWDDRAVTALAVRLAPGADADRVARELEAALRPVQRVLVRPNRALREAVLAVFDRTFAITGALQMLATVVAFIGVLSALLSLQLDKRRQLGVLRAVGLTVRELWALVLLETGLMGAVAGLLAMPAGYGIALILVYVINRRSFGWTLQMAVDGRTFGEAFLLAVLAALLAGVYPAYRLGRTAAADALRYE